MSNDNKITKKDEYFLLGSLITNAESISWSRFNSFLLFNSIIILAWTTVFSKEPSLPILQCALSIFGLISCFFWSALGFRGRRNINMILQIGRKIETDSSGEKPLTKAIKLRDEQPFSWAGSIYVLTLIPLCIATLYVILLWLSISDLIIKTVLITIAIIFIIFFLFLTLGYIKIKTGGNMNKKSNPAQNLTLIFILIAIVIVCFVYRSHLTISSSSDLILLITFFALFWYADETRRTRQNLEKQIDIALTPIISLEIIENAAAGYRFKLKNVGSGLARDIKITNNTVVCRNAAYPLKDNETKMANPKFNIPCFLYGGEEKMLAPLQKGEQDLWIIKKPGSIQIECRNIEGKIDSRKFVIKERCKDEKNWTYWQIEVEN